MADSNLEPDGRKGDDVINDTPVTNITGKADAGHQLGR